MLHHRIPFKAKGIRQSWKYFSTGLRVSELTKLDRDKIDLERHEFGIIGKGGKARVVFMSTRATDWLVKYLNERPDHFKPLLSATKETWTQLHRTRKCALLPLGSADDKKYSHKMKLPFEVTLM